MMNKLLRMCLWLFFLSVLIKCGAGNFKIKVQSTKVMCPDNYEFDEKHQIYDGLDIQDYNTGEYVCNSSTGSKTIYIKFRSCDNCVELDVVSLTGLIFGNVLATFVIGISVYLIARHGQIGTATINKKASDKQPLVPPDTDGRIYQPLRKNRDREIYDQLQK